MEDSSCFATTAQKLAILRFLPSGANALPQVFLLKGVGLYVVQEERRGLQEERDALDATHTALSDARIQLEASLACQAKHQCPTTSS